MQRHLSSESPFLCRLSICGSNTPAAACSVSCRWYLGIQSKKDPAHVMNEVYKAMQALKCVWHQVNNYRVLCLWKYTSGIVPKPIPSPTVKNVSLSVVLQACETVSSKIPP
jgi:hypothetical protein